MEEALIAHLLADSGVQALAQTGAAAARLYWVHAPQGVAKPYATLFKVAGLRDTPLSGPNGFQQSRVQVDCYGLTYASAKGLARAIEAAVGAGRFTQNGIEFQACFLVAERDGFESDATPDKLFRVSLDFTTHHNGV
jgi:hypothetical protein